MSANPERKRIKRELRVQLGLTTHRGMDGWNGHRNTDYAYTDWKRERVEDLLRAQGFTLHLHNEQQSVWLGPNRVRVAVEPKLLRTKIYVLEH